MKVFRKVLFTLALAGNITILSSQNVAVFDEFLYKSESQMKASENQYLNPTASSFVKFVKALS